MYTEFLQLIMFTVSGWWVNIFHMLIVLPLVMFIFSGWKSQEKEDEEDAPSLLQVGVFDTSILANI